MLEYEGWSPPVRRLERMRAADGSDIQCVVVEAATLGSLQDAWAPYAAGHDVAVALDQMKADQHLEARLLLSRVTDTDGGTTVDGFPPGLDDRGSTFVLLAHPSPPAQGDEAGDREPRDPSPAPSVASIELALHDED